MTKAELRSLFSQKRNSLSDIECLQLNHQLCENFFAMVDLNFIKVVHIFLSIEKNKEPNTWLIIDRLRREFPHIRISVPRVNHQSAALDNFFLDGLDQLKTNSWGIPEPVKGIPTDVTKIDMVLIPLLAFDLNGQRVGYGKGYYDKLLAQCKPSCRRVGLSFFNAVDAIDDIGSHDQKLTSAVTPDGVQTFH